MRPLPLASLWRRCTRAALALSALRGSQLGALRRSSCPHSFLRATADCAYKKTLLDLEAGSSLSVERGGRPARTPVVRFRARGAVRE